MNRQEILITLSDAINEMVEVIMNDPEPIARADAAKALVELAKQYMELKPKSNP